MLPHEGPGRHTDHCKICNAYVPYPHVPPYETIPTERDSLIAYLRDRWDLWGAELLIDEAGSVTIIAAVTETLWRLHRGQDVRSPAGTIASMARRMSRARRAAAKAGS